MRESSVTGRQITVMGVSRLVEGLQWHTEELLRIGRLQSLDIVVQEPSISRQHAEIRATPQGWVVQDLGSASGTLLNGVSVKQARKLQKDDVLQFGKVTFRVSQLEWELPAAFARPVTQDIRTTGPIMRVQAFSQLSWEQGLRELSLPDARLAHAKQFLTLLRAGYHLSRIDSVSELLQSLLDDTVAVLNAQRGAILLIDESSGQLTLKTVAGPKGRNGSRAFSNTVAERCFGKGESLLCLDVNQLAEAPKSGSMERANMASIICTLLRSPRRRLGVLHLDRGPLQEPFSPEDFQLADAIAATVSVGIESAVGVDKQRGQFLQEVFDLAQQILEVRDPGLARHSQRVADLALLLADELHLGETEKQQLHMGALLHDLGKIGVAEAVLKKPRALTLEEEKLLRAHPLHGVAIAEKISGFTPALGIIRNHHERWDGKGYPDGLSDEAIPRLARVVALADALDNLTTVRPSGSALSLDQALSAIQRESGKHFDPGLVQVLLGLRPRLETTRGLRESVCA